MSSGENQTSIPECSVSFDGNSMGNQPNGDINCPIRNMFALALASISKSIRKRETNEICHVVITCKLECTAIQWEPKLKTQNWNWKQWQCNMSVLAFTAKPITNQNMFFYIFHFDARQHIYTRITQKRLFFLYSILQCDFWTSLNTGSDEGKLPRQVVIRRVTVTAVTVLTSHLDPWILSIKWKISNFSNSLEYNKFYEKKIKIAGFKLILKSVLIIMVISVSLMLSPVNDVTLFWFAGSDIWRRFF